MRKFLRDNFYILTLFFAASIYIAILNSDMPYCLPIEGLEWLFVTNRRNTMLYDLMIGYSCSYFFYVLQVYIPDINKQNKAEKIIKYQMCRLVSTLEKCTFLYKLIPNRYGKETVYYREQQGEYQVSRAFETMHMEVDLCDELTKNYSAVVDSPYFFFLDQKTIEIISEIPINRWKDVLIIPSARIRDKDSDLLSITEKKINELKTIKIWESNYNIVQEKDDIVIKQLKEKARDVGYSYGIKISE